MPLFKRSGDSLDLRCFKGKHVSNQTPQKGGLTRFAPPHAGDHGPSPP
jgi:hypothetical protein